MSFLKQNKAFLDGEKDVDKWNAHDEVEIPAKIVKIANIYIGYMNKVLVILLRERGTIINDISFKSFGRTR
jgi:hypothetical protein